MQFQLTGRAVKSGGGAGRFACIEIRVKIRHALGGDDESNNYASFDQVNEEFAPGDDLIFGGGEHYHNFGLPSVETEDLICRRPDGLPNIEVVCVFDNVTIAPAATPPGDTATLYLQEPIFRVYWSYGNPLEPLGPQPQELECLSAETILGGWTNLANACDPAQEHDCEVAYLETCSVRYKFGHTVSPDSAQAMRDAVCHKCVDPAIEDEVILAEICPPSNGGPGFDIDNKYKVLDGDTWKICYVRVCDTADDPANRVTDFDVQDDCDDVDCPNPDCECINDPPGDWIWTDDDSHEWTDGNNAIWTNSLDGSCDCGCANGDLYLGVPHWIDLPRVAAAGLSPHNNGPVEFSVCIGALGGVGTGTPVTVFGYARTFYHRTHIPFQIYWEHLTQTWRARFSGTYSAVPPLTPHTSFDVDGPKPAGVTLCSWHRVRLEWVSARGVWRLGVDINDDSPYTFNWGAEKEPPAGFSMYTPLTYHWGAWERRPLVEADGNFPPYTLKT